MLTGCAKSTSALIGVAAEAQQRKELQEKLKQQREQNTTALEQQRAAEAQQRRELRETSELASSSPCWQSRIDNANRKRGALVVENLLAKLGGMRGQLLPHMLPPDLEAFAQPGLQGFAVKSVPAGTHSLGASDFGCSSRGAGLGDSFGSKTKSFGKTGIKVVAGLKVTAEQLARRKGAQRRLRVFKGVIWTLMGYLTHKKRTTGVARIKMFLGQVGEWARVRAAAKSLVGRIRIMQRCCRECLASKKRRCDELSKYWERVETNFLSEYFKKYAKKILQESNAAYQDLQTTGSSKAGRSKKSLAQESLMKEALEKAGVDADTFAENSLDWKALRIPKEERRERIGRHYMLRLKQFVREQKVMLEKAQRAVQHQKEMNIFLKEFSGDEAAVVKGVLCGEDLAQSVAPRFWELTEDTMLDLIACAANALRNQKPYHLHPANTDVSGDYAMRREKLARGASKRQSGRGSSSSPPSSAAAGDGADASMGREAGRSGSKVVCLDIPGVRRKDSKLDVEAVLNRFSPRFREMKEMAANAPVEVGDDGTTGHGKGVYVPTPDAKNVELTRLTNAHAL